MIFTIADIDKGDWVTTVYDRETPFLVTAVIEGRDEFEAHDTENNEIWKRLSSNDILKVQKKVKTVNNFKLNNHGNQNQLG